MKCPNCGKTDFEKMDLYDIIILDGSAKQLVDSYVCMNCGRVELFMPKELIEKKNNERNNERRYQEELKQAQENLNRQEARLQSHIRELEDFIKDENNTLKAIKSAQEELSETQKQLKKIREDYSGEINRIEYQYRKRRF